MFVLAPPLYAFASPVVWACAILHGLQRSVRECQQRGNHLTCDATRRVRSAVAFKSINQRKANPVSDLQSDWTAVMAAGREGGGWDGGGGWGVDQI